MQDLLQRGIAAARAGRRTEARALLMQVVEVDERSELGWLWLSGVLDSPEDIRVCLENVIEINPENRQARQGLEWLRARTGATPAESHPSSTEIDPPASQAAPLPTYSAPQPSTIPAPEPAPSEPAPSQPEPALRISDSNTPTLSGAEEPSDPCPYCGAPTNIGQRNCLRCRNSLMVRDRPATQRSIWTTILGWLRIIDAVTTALGALVVLAVAVLAFQLGQQPGARQEIGSLAFLIATIGVIGLALAGFYLSVGRGLLRRARWAYIVTIVLAAFSLLSSLVQMVSGSLMQQITERLAESRSGPVPIETGQSIGGFLIVLSLVIQVVYIALIVFSYGDFYGPLRRFQVSFKRTDHAVHYNNGVAYKDRGMWYMAMREWELAVSRAPFDLNYLHALGLAYAQIGRFDRARSTLDKALSIAPNHRQLTDSRALVEQMAAKQQKQ